MKTDIFLNSYQQAENKLTYNFLAVIELLNNKEFCEFLTNKILATKPVKNIRTVYGGGESNPDGSFELTSSDNKTFNVYFENKTHRRGLSSIQLLSHLNYCSENDILLVVTTRKSDIQIVREINNIQIKFLTWSEIAGYLKSNFNTEIITQFLEYGKQSGEFEEFGDLHYDDIKLYCDALRINFDNRLSHILTTFFYELDMSKYGFNNINKTENKIDWGRKGVELNWNSTEFTYGQWWAISYYHNTSDHEIPFKNDVPEIVAFFDIHESKRDLLATDNEFNSILTNLEDLGFESNLNGELTKNKWRLFIYRKPVTKFKVLNTIELLNFADETFGKLLEANAIRHRYFSEFKFKILP